MEGGKHMLLHTKAGETGARWLRSHWKSLTLVSNVFSVPVTAKIKISAEDGPMKRLRMRVRSSRNNI